MAKPWKHPDTGTYYLRRQIPAAIRAAFNNKPLFKQALGTKDPARAAVLFLQANAELELRFEAARARLRATGSPCPSTRDRAVELVDAYFNGPAREDGGLDGSERLLLARLELDRGLWNETPQGLTTVSPSDDETWWRLANNAALFRTHAGFAHRIQGRAPGAVWRFEDRAFKADARERQVGRIVHQIARHNDIGVDALPEELGAEIAAFLDAQPVGVQQLRKPRASTGRLQPDMRLMELFEKWKSGNKPRPQSANEYEVAARDFIDFLGDIPVAEIINDDLLDYRDEAKKLPNAMPRADRALPFMQRVAKLGVDQPRAEGEKVPTAISVQTLKKRIGGIQALLTYAHQQKWTRTNVGRDVPIVGYTKSSGLKRRTFSDDELRGLLGSTLFTSPSRWKWSIKTTDCTLFWLFLFCMTTGARIEEYGQALLADVRSDDGVVYIDVTDYLEVDDETASADSDSPDVSKSLKTEDSRRLIPVHNRLLALGFESYCAALRAAGHVRLFPDLHPNGFDKHTQDASKRANRLIDRVVAGDRRLVFHSFRHGFKDRATEARIGGRVIDQICGHAPTTVGGGYGTGVRLTALRKALHRVDWRFLDWDRLAAGMKDIDWASVAARHHRTAVR